MLKQGLLGQVASMKEFFNRSTRNLVEDDSAFSPQLGLFTSIWSAIVRIGKRDG